MDNKNDKEIHPATSDIVDEEFHDANVESYEEEEDDELEPGSEKITSLHTLEKDLPSPQDEKSVDSSNSKSFRFVFRHVMAIESADFDFDDAEEDDDDKDNDDGGENKDEDEDEGGVSVRSLFNSIHTNSDLFKDRFKDYMKSVIAKEFPQKKNPSLKNLIRVGNLRKGARFRPGEYVELRSTDMKYRIEMITRVAKLAPKDWDWNDPENEGKTPEWEFFYDADDIRMIDGDEVRSPKEGLIHIFGSRPWVWQQWACLKLEKAIRFQEGHQDDFMSIDIEKRATELWDRWLYHPANKDFLDVYMDERIGDGGRYELVNHILSPFKLMDDLVADPEKWNFEAETRFSVFTYLGLLGSGFTFPIAIIMLQVAIPGVLVWNLLRDDDNSDEDDSETCNAYSLTGFTNGCAINPVAQAMGVVVLLFYLFKVVPDVLYDFYETTGTTESLYSKLVSMRRNIWMRGDDRPEQQFGFRMDIYMNTAYVSFLYMLNIFITINTNDAFELLLNALAFEFVINLDEAFVGSVWWDRDRRWIKAGAMELMIQSVLMRKKLRDLDMFCEWFRVPKEVLSSTLKSDTNFMYNAAVAAADEENTDFMSEEEAMKHLCKVIAFETHNEAAISEYHKAKRFFGFWFRLVDKLSGAQHGGVFDRYSQLCTWSRWEELLYAAPMPNLGDYLSTDSRGRTVVDDKWADVTSTDNEPFENLDIAYLEGGDDESAFLRFFFAVLTFSFGFSRIWAALREKHFLFVLFQAGDVFLQWISFVIQLVFPVYTVVCVLGLGYNMIVTEF